MFQGIVQRFLCNSKQGKRNVLRQGARNILIYKFDGHLMLSRELVAEISHGSGDAKIVQPRRVELMRYSLKIVRDFGAMTPNLVNLSLGARGSVRLAIDLFQLQR